LEDFGRPGSYYRRQFERWTKQYRASATETIPAMEELIAWLSKHMPTEDGRVAIVHGDYRLDNMIFDTNTEKLLAIIDWELSTLGHPLADLAYQCMQWRMHRGGFMQGLGDLDRIAVGIPSEERYVEQYCQRIGMTGIDHWDFYVAFSFFRLAAILQGVKKRGLDGNASNTRAVEMGELIQPMVQLAVAGLS